jgi:Zn-dependent protease
MCLNLLPILPLDGGRIVASLLPHRMAWQYARLEPWGLPLLVLLLVTNVLDDILVPLVGLSHAVIRALVL